MTASPARANPWDLLAQKILGDRRPIRKKWLCDRPDCDGEPHEGYHWCDHPLDSDAHRPDCRHARAEQRPPPGLTWLIWLILAGRGWGKTRTGAEWLAEQVLTSPPGEWAIVARTYADCRDTCVEGVSGFLVALAGHGLTRDVDFTYNRSIGEIRFPNGAVVFMLTDEKPDAIRGKNLRGAWADEMAAWRNTTYTWTEALSPALRIGERPRVVITTTPKPIPLLRDFVKRTDGTVHRTKGSMYANRKNLSAVALAELERRFAGTRVGRQELEGELLEDVEGALWQRAWIDRDRLLPGHLDTRAGGLDKVVVGVDPAGSSAATADMTGIVVAGRGKLDRHGYVLSDRTLRGTPAQWGAAAVKAYHELQADIIVAEKNYGGEMVQHVIQTADPRVPVIIVSATRGKKVRAEPVAAMYEQQRWHHIGSFPELEDELTTWDPDDPHADSPNRLDALVWCGHALFPLGEQVGHRIPSTDNRLAGSRRR